MKRFILTSKDFKGKVEVIYRDGVFCRIDIMEAVLTKEWIKWLKGSVPVLSENIYTNFKETPVAITEVEFEATFEDFKKVYPRKRNTHLAAKYWPKLTSGNQYLAYISAVEYNRYCNRKELAQEFIMLPEKYLRQEMWRNDWKTEI